MVSRKHKCYERLRAMLEVYRVLDSVIYLDDHTYGTHEQSVRAALIALEKSDPSLDTLNAVYALLEGTLSQALNRNPALPWVVGAKAVSGDVGSVP